MHKSSDKQKLITVDLDGTLIRGDISRFTFLHLGPIDLLKVFYIRYLRNDSHHFSLFLIEKFNSSWKGNLLFRLRVQEYAIRGLNRELIKALKIHQLDHQIGIVSGSSQLFLDWLVAHLQMDFGIGSTSLNLNRGINKGVRITEEYLSSQYSYCISVSNNKEDQCWSSDFSLNILYAKKNASDLIGKIPKHSC